MTQQNINQFLSKYLDYFPPEKIWQIQWMLERWENVQLHDLERLKFKKPITVWFWSFVAGTLGIDRFIVGQPMVGFLKLLTVGGMLIWWFIDLFRIIKLTQRRNYRMFLYHLKTKT